MTETIPPGFRLVSDNHRPPKGDTKYEVIFRNGFVDRTGYTASQLVWIHDGSSWDIVAVKAIGEDIRGGAAWNPKSGGY